MFIQRNIEVGMVKMLETIRHIAAALRLLHVNAKIHAQMMARPPHTVRAKPMPQRAL
jgi:hypothetical protein